MTNNPENSTNFQQLIEQLYHPQSRRAARQKLVAAKAVGPLLECLESTNELVVWAAVESLQELRASEAVGPLVDLLERGVLVVDVTEALRTITGQNFGADVKRWRQWIGDPTTAESAELDVAECIRRTAELLGVEPTGSGKSFRFKLSLPDGRSQRVDVYFGREDSEGDSLVVIYSECGPAVAKYYEAVLRKNITIPAGAFAIRDIKGQPNFVMVDTMIAAVVTPGALAKKIENIAARADIVEKGLTKEDRR